jgi:hypothetical protein
MFPDCIFLQGFVELTLGPLLDDRSAAVLGLDSNSRFFEQLFALYHKVLLQICLQQTKASVDMHDCLLGRV